MQSYEKHLNKVVDNSKKNVRNYAVYVLKVLYLHPLTQLLTFSITITMAKGNMFLSQARGKVGSVVFSVIKGQQVERVYNPSPANPRTNGQQAQRSLLANMTKFYKRGTKNFYKFAYEDRTIRESDFNAFARKNTMRGVYMPKELYDHAGTPALGKYIVSDGSIATNIADYFSGENYGVLVPGSAAITTVGQFCTALMTQSPGIAVGDIFTMVLADSEFGAEMMSAGDEPTWTIYQFYIDPSDLRPLANVGLANINLAAGTTGRFVGVNIAGVDRASFGATIISRNTPAGLLVSTSELKGSAVANVLYDWLRGEYMKRQAAISWGANPDAVLQGGLIGTLPEVTTVRVGGGNAIPAYTYGVGNLDFSAAGVDVFLLGSNLRTSAQGGQYKLKFYPADIVSDYLVNTPVIEATATATADTGGVALGISLGDHPDIARIQQCYMLIEAEGVPVWYGLVIG